MWIFYAFAPFQQCGNLVVWSVSRVCTELPPKASRIPFLLSQQTLVEEVGPHHPPLLALFRPTHARPIAHVGMVIAGVADQSINNSCFFLHSWRLKQFPYLS